MALHSSMGKYRNTAYTPTYTRTHIDRQTDTRTHAHTHTHSLIYPFAHTHTDARTNTHPRSRARTHTTQTRCNCYSVTPAHHRETLAATVLGEDIASWQGFLVEAMITFILVLTVFGATNSDRKPDLHMPTIPIGLAVALGIMSGVGRRQASSPSSMSVAAAHAVFINASIG